MKVLIGTPAYGGQVTVPYLTGLLSLCNSANARGIQVEIMTLTNESLITRGRNEIVAAFMEGDYTHLLFIDADIEFTPDHVWRLVESGHELSCTPYPMKGLNWDRMIQAEQTEEALREASFLSVVNGVLADDVTPEGFLAVHDAGTGFMCIQRSVIERMSEAHPETAYLSDHSAHLNKPRFALFDCAIVNGRYLSEDYLFCHRWRELGGTVYADVASTRLGHMGSYIYGK